jgi:hypothetical protein
MDAAEGIAGYSMSLVAGRPTRPSAFSGRIMAACLIPVGAGAVATPRMIVRSFVSDCAPLRCGGLAAATLRAAELPRDAHDEPWHFDHSALFTNRAPWILGRVDAGILVVSCLDHPMLERARTEQ